MVTHFLEESKTDGENGSSGADEAHMFKMEPQETIQMVVNYDPHKHEAVTTTVKADVVTNSSAVTTKGLPCWIMKPEEPQKESVELIAGDKEGDESEELVCTAEISCTEDGEPPVRKDGDSTNRTISRKAGAGIHIPFTKRSSKIEYKKMSEKLSNMKKLDHILPMGQMQSILGYLSIHSDMVVETDVGNFDLHRMRYMDFLHHLHNNQLQIQEEDEWFGEELLMPFQCEATIQSESIYTFHQLIQENGCSSSVALPGCSAAVSDMLSLPCERWLTDGVLDCFAHMVREQTDCLTEVFNVTEMAEMSGICAHLEKKYPDKTGIQVIFLLHVGKAEHENPYPGQTVDDRTYTASHFSFALYSFDKNDVLYADTLGWSIPEPLYFMMDEFITHFGLQEPSFSCLHDPESMQDPENHVCSNRCARLYPAEQFDCAFGIAVVVGFCLAAVDREAFSLITATSGEIVHPNKLDYLQDVAQYSKFLRLVLICWLVKGEININMLFQICQEDVKPHQMPRLSLRRRKRRIPFGASPESSPEREVTHTRRTVSGRERVTPAKGNINFDKISDLLTKPPEVGYLRSYSCLRVRFYLKNGKLVTKRFKCTTSGKNDGRALKKVQSYVDREEVYNWLKEQSEIVPKQRKNWLKSKNEGVNALLLKAELVTQGMGSLRLRCTLKNGVTKSKIYSGEKDDPRVRQEVLDFLSSRMCEEWLKEERKWFSLEDVNVGVATRNYIDSISFDVKKKCIKVDRRVRPVSGADTLSVSVEANPNWGKLHRYDETYELKEGKSRPGEKFIAVTMILQCASLTSECRSDCGVSLKSITTHGKLCSGCQISLDSGRTCEGCFITDSPHWYSNETFSTLCNACYRANGQRKTLRRKDRIHHPHLKCKWKLKFELDQNLKTWLVYKGASNEFYHNKEPVGERKRPTWAERDVWDKARILTNATAHEIYHSMQKEMPLLASDPKNSAHALGQITRRCKSIDKKYLHLAMNWKKDPNPTCSDWRKAEKVLETNFDKVLHFQRGDKMRNRDYRVIIATDNTLQALSDYGQEVIGYDSKQEFMSSCFKCSLITYGDETGKEQTAVVAICNREAEDTHNFIFQILAANMPCRDPNCEHPKMLYIYNDGNGFFWVRPCSMSNGFRPLVQHESKVEIRNAVNHMFWHSSLYNYHTVDALRSYISSTEHLQLIKGPLELGFKCMMMSWNTDMRKKMEFAYKEFIFNTIPDTLISRPTKHSFIHYLDKFWFDCSWSDTYTAQVGFKVTDGFRRNTLLCLENMAEKRPKEAEEPDSNARNKRMSHFAVKMLNKILRKGIYQVQKSEEKYGVIEQREEDILTIQKGFSIFQNRGVKCHLGWEEHGFVSVKATENPNQEEFPTTSLDDSDVPILSSPVHVKKSVYTQVKQIQEQYGNDLTSIANAVLQPLNALALDLYRQEISRYISTQVRSNITHHEHICNIYLRTCSCFAFIDNGQMELCKHLYAALIMIRNLKDVDSVVIEGMSWAPRVPVALKSFMNFSRNMNLPGYIINKVESLQAMSRCATELDMEKANRGEILSILHGPSGTTEAKNSGYQKSGIVRKYALTDMSDPYCPNIEFPKSLRSRRGEKGVKRERKRMLETDDIPVEASQLEEKKIRVANPETECREFGEHNVFYVTLPDDAPEELHDVGTTEDGRETRDEESTESTLYHTKSFPSIVCGRCIDEGKGSPQLCYSPKELQSHIEREHPEKNLVCAFCYFNNTYTRYSTIKELNDHLLQEH
ncbi:hypothetical protein Pcinc_030215 [Petrolisthes cinctipes]|uniref:SWIM-type domain-containing protein n=1 Tax=Petrolisthes cinctipes TaxID=88211 RepID=A0AAE1EZA6_PETCI|nr:hypothetical protein Pcinc_030215 [Petrolisthes cinctipes]